MGSQADDGIGEDNIPATLITVEFPEPVTARLLMAGALAFLIRRR